MLEGLEAFDGVKQQFGKGIKGAAAVSEALRGFGRVGSVWGCQTAVEALAGLKAFGGAKQQFRQSKGMEGATGRNAVRPRRSGKWSESV